MALPSISIASIVIGFISFSFTLAIWLHAFWDAFLTLGSAPNQIQDALSVLRQGLYEEREHLKRKRRRGEGDHPGSKLKSLYYEGGPTRVINDAVKDLIKEFKNYERPFLVTPHEGREKELEWSFDATQQYYKSDFWHRLLWLRARGHIYNIANRLEKAQIRRIAQETTETQFMLRDTMGMVREYENRLRAIEERLQMSRIGY
ncbi:uncharacterized protein K444DRAFT_540598 [Hyaloscypha bicolor E]|uniref:Uncharacterized protein n=1 Tax=Hyaloscypha bicolor E TaxID=1095630 RepID=A0A2J6STV1_9HELO|nr:uncharacterized protein K444DRAFT_540598 [Hyaloscypha bicolor E]PMD54180.1 hypothetical protein K444DRAFT_540598 [Hyaloscypha bicolor E]